MRILSWIMQLVDIFSGIFDNWVYLKRIGVINFYNKWQETWVDWLSSLATFSFIILQIIEKIMEAYITAMNKYD
jgi:hypothetical protein